MDNDVVRIYNEVLFGIKKNAFESALMRWMNLEPIIQSEVSHKNKYTISMHIWNLERWYWWNNLQGSNRDTDIKNRLVVGRSQDGGGIGRGDHFLPYKFIERTFEWWADFTKQLLTASRRHHVPRKAAHCLQKEHDWTSEPKQETTSNRLCQGGNQTLKRPANRSQINTGNRFRSDQGNRLKSL